MSFFLILTTKKEVKSCLTKIEFKLRQLGKYLHSTRSHKRIAVYVITAIIVRDKVCNQNFFKQIKSIYFF